MKSSWFSELDEASLTILSMKCLVINWWVYLPGGSSRSWSSEHLTLSYYEPVSYHVKGYQPWALIFGPQFPRAHMFQSSGVRLQDDQGNQLLWKAAQQDAHHLQEMRKCKQLLTSYLRTYRVFSQVSFHIQKKTCAACGFPAAKIRGYNWSIKVRLHASWLQRSLLILICLCL